MKNWTFEICGEVVTKKTAATYNKIQRTSDAKYKFFLQTPIANINPNIFFAVINSFFFKPNFALLGLFGSELPSDGDYTKAKNFYGEYNFVDVDGQQKNYHGQPPLFSQRVHVVDDGFFATAEDVDWDEKVDDEFLIAAQCCRLREKNFEVGVVYQDSPQIIFMRDEFSYSRQLNEKSRKKFFSRYKKVVAPLVSICIPTYNQPEFFRQALESALAQTYPNVEILVGDDSTNTQTTLSSFIIIAECKEGPGILLKDLA